MTLRAEQAAGSRRARLRQLIGPGIMTLVMILLMLGLGTWQVQRLHWKLGILADIDRAEAAPPVPLPPHPSRFTKVEVTGRLRSDRWALYGAEVRDGPSGPEMGGQLIEPLERDGAEPILIDLGWVPENYKPSATPAGTDTTIAGYVHEGDKPGFLSASDDLARRQFFTLDPEAIGPALGFSKVAPFALVALGPAQFGVYPMPAQHLPRPPNNHLEYAITWYGLAAVLVIVFIAWIRKTLTA